MAKNADVIKALNLILKNELTAINQYFLHARMLRHLGYIKMAEHEHAESIDEMKHADLVIQRIFMIGGMPNLQDLGRLMIGENPIEIVECDYKLELQVLADLKKAHAICEAAGDRTSINLVEEILASEEKHIEELNAQRGLIVALGEQNFLQSMV
ncbi:MAG: bacterioferritin [Rickettsiales bacterium]|jgi:bacterioferritin|nr:bacterioferritin [Rickettsiales bacterium]